MKYKCEHCGRPIEGNMALMDEMTGKLFCYDSKFDAKPGARVPVGLTCHAREWAHKHGGVDLTAVPMRDVERYLTSAPV